MNRALVGHQMSAGGGGEGKGGRSERLTVMMMMVQCKRKWAASRYLVYFLVS